MVRITWAFFLRNTQYVTRTTLNLPWEAQTMNTTDIEKKLLSHPLPGPLPAAEGWVMPHYEGLSIANLPATIAALLGEELPGCPARPAP